MSTSRDDPGLPLSTLSGQPRCMGVRFHCRRCAATRDVPFAQVAADLERRGVGGWATPIRRVADFARRPCDGCGNLTFTTAPWWR